MAKMCTVWRPWARRDSISSFARNMGRLSEECIASLAIEASVDTYIRRGVMQRILWALLGHCVGFCRDCFACLHDWDCRILEVCRDSFSGRCLSGLLIVLRELAPAHETLNRHNFAVVKTNC